MRPAPAAAAASTAVSATAELDRQCIDTRSTLSMDDMHAADSRHLALDKLCSAHDSNQSFGVAVGHVRGVAHSLRA